MSIRDEAVEVLVKKAASMFDMPESELSADTSFENDLHAKSTQYVQLSAALEDEFEIEVPYMEFRRMGTFADAAAFIGEQFGE